MLGTEIDFIAELDSKYLSDEGVFKRKAEAIRQKREENGEQSIYSLLRPFLRPELTDLVGQRIDYCACFGKAGLRWCQGEVLSVCASKSKPKVNVLFDAMQFD